MKIASAPAALGAGAERHPANEGSVPRGYLRLNGVLLVFFLIMAEKKPAVEHPLRTTTFLLRNVFEWEELRADCPVNAAGGSSTVRISP